MSNQFSFPRSSVQGKGSQGLRQNFVERQKFIYKASLIFAPVLEMNKLWETNTIVMQNRLISLQLQPFMCRS